MKLAKWVEKQIGDLSRGVQVCHPSTIRYDFCCNVIDLAQAVIAMFLLSYFDLWMESYDQYSEQRTLVIPCCLLVGAVLLQLTASA